MKEFYKTPDEGHRKVALGSLPGLPYKLKKSLEQISKLSVPMSKPKAGEWLWQHQEEGQTYDAYKGQLHNEVDTKRNVIYIKPLETMDKQFIGFLKQYCQCFFTPLKVKILETEKVLKDVRNRINQYTEKKQYHARDILENLRKVLPGDAFCLIGACVTDLYPRDQWNFVFGIASIRQRTGVFSFARYDERFFGEGKYEVNYDKILWRTLGVMTHQIIHMFGVRHCIYYNCLMNGSNHDQEASSKPMSLCVVCLRKLQSNIKFDILERFLKIHEFIVKTKDKRVQKFDHYLKTAISNLKESIK